MAANTSQSQARTIVLRAKVADYAEWALVVACKPCSAVRTVPLAILPQDATIMQVVMRMRCRTCRGRVEAAAVDNQVPGWRRRMVQVWGPGSYG